MLNNTQKNILEATLQYLFDAIAEDAPIEIAIDALKAITDDALYAAHQAEFTRYDIRSTLDELRKIYQHPRPQNRAVGSPYVGQDPGMAVWRDALTHDIQREPLGLLGLTAQNQPGTEPVTAFDVREQMKVLINAALVELQSKQLAQLQQTVAAIQASTETQPTLGSGQDFFNLSPEALLNHAQSLLAQRKSFEALPYLNQLIAHAPQHAEYRYLRGRTLAILGRRDEALCDFTHALKHRPQHAQTWVERGFTLENLGDIQGAIRDYTQALTLEPIHAFALCQRGGLLMDTGRMAEGEHDYIASLSSKPNDSNTYRSRGERMLACERYEDAIADFTETLRLWPNQPKIKAMKAEAEILLLRQAQQLQTTPANASPSGCQLS